MTGKFDVVIVGAGLAGRACDEFLRFFTPWCASAVPSCATMRSTAPRSLAATGS